MSVRDALSDPPIDSASSPAEELARHEALSAAVLHAAESFLTNAHWETDVADVLEQLGTAAGVSRVYVFENHLDEAQRLLTSQRFEWVAAGIDSHIANATLQALAIHEAGFGRWVQILEAHGSVRGPVATLPASERALLEQQGILSIAVVPIFVNDRWWGFMGFDDCEQERTWSDSTLAVLRTAADLFGAAVFRNLADENRRRLQHEVTARREAQAAKERATFLAEATSILASSFDYDTTLARFARAAVPFLGDYCIVDLLDGGEIRRVATAHADPAKEHLVRALVRFPPTWETNPIVRSLRTGTSVMAGPHELTPESISADAEHREILRQLAPQHGLFAPIKSANAVIGVVSFCSCDRGRPYGMEELAFAEDLAIRGGMAIGNAQLFHTAQEAKRTRDEVLAVVAHDLRNPLNAIHGAAQLLERRSDDPMTIKLAAMIHQGSVTMNRLIEDLLDANRLERGAMPIAAAPVPLCTILADAMTMLQPLARARGIRLEVVDPDPVVHVLADTTRVLQVLSNLIGNALKFTPEGGVVRLRAAVVEESQALIQVEDSGPGIPADQLPNLFDRFWQANSSDRRGVGLGLAIARGIVEAHGGRIWVETERGIGSTFNFTLLLADAADRTAIDSPRRITA